MSHVRSLLLLPAFLLAGISSAQTATVYGVVSESLDGELYPIPFAKVSVEGSRYSSGPVVPDLEGAFSIDGIPAGEYWLTVAAVGFDTLDRKITLGAGDSLEVRVFLGAPEAAGMILLREYVSDAPVDAGEKGDGGF